MKLSQTLKKILIRRGALPALCYAVVLLGWLVYSAYGMASDGVARAQGRLTQQTLHAADFTLVDLEPVSEATGVENGEAADILITTSGDPQMILEEVRGETVRTLRAYAEYEGTAREMCLYYTTAPDQPYSQDRRVFPAQQADGSYLYTLPRGTLYALRFDPCSPEQDKTVTISLEKITLNSDLGGYFVPSWYQLFCFVLYPGLAAALLSWGMAVYRAFAKKHTS